jgi:SAM-dependent methyltransferase
VTSVRALLDKIDISRLREIQKRHASSTDRYAKYAEIERWLKINVARARDLELDRAAPQTILDLGCGAGFFLFVAKQFGHSGLGLDVDDFPVPNELIDLFRVERKVWRIRAFQPLPDLGRKFDLITAFSTAFNRNDTNHADGAGTNGIFSCAIWTDISNRAAGCFLRSTPARTRAIFCRR